MDRKCPRCERKTFTCIGESPIESKWALFRCDYCIFVWRSTEEPYLEPCVAKLTDDEIRNLIWPYDPKSK